MHLLRLLTHGLVPLYTNHLARVPTSEMQTTATCVADATSGLHPQSRPTSAVRMISNGPSTSRHCGQRSSPSGLAPSPFMFRFGSFQAQYEVVCMAVQRRMAEELSLDLA